MSSLLRVALRRVAYSYVLVVAVGLVVGLSLAPVAYETTAPAEKTVAVVPLAGTIGGGTTTEVSSMLDKARNDPDVAAVVIVANSGGGGAAPSEELYLQTKRTAAEMPVVTAVDATAASGAYYAVVPSDHIYVKPSSLVGSVGVLATLPGDVEPNDVVATTGPDKLSGADQREFHYMLDSLAGAFYNAVTVNRGDRLELSREELSQGRLYTGGQAVRNGLADDVGGRQAAIQHAADLAGVDDYQVRVLYPGGPTYFLSQGNYVAADVPEKRLASPSRYVDRESGVPTFLMMPAAYVSTSDHEPGMAGAVAANATSTGAPDR